MAISKLPADVGDENGETIIDERKIRIKPLPKKIAPKPPLAPVDLPVSDVGLVRRSVNFSRSQKINHHCKKCILRFTDCLFDCNHHIDVFEWVQSLCRYICICYIDIYLSGLLHFIIKL